MQWLNKFSKNIKWLSKIWSEIVLRLNEFGFKNKPIIIENMITKVWIRFKLPQKISRIQQPINNFDINITIYPEIKEQILTLTGTILDILAITNEDKPYLRELLHHLSIPYNTITCRSGLTSTGLMYSQATVTLITIEESSADVIRWIENWNLGSIRVSDRNSQ